MTKADSAARPLNLAPATVRTMRRVAFGLAVVALAVSFLGERYAWLDYRPGGAAFGSLIWPLFSGVLLVSLLLSLKWELAGGILAIFAGATLVAFATNQLVAMHAFGVIVSIAAPAVLWVLIDLSTHRRRGALAALAFALVAAFGGFFLGQTIYDRIYGPTHAESPLVALPDSQLEWIWSGAVTSTSAEVRARPAIEFTTARLAVSLSPDLADVRWIDTYDASGRVLGFGIDELVPDTTYFYAIELDDELDRTRAGRLHTFPEGPASFTIAVGSCARVGSNGAVFDTIRELDPLFYLITGDMHYGDNGRNDIVRYEEVMDLTLAMPAQSALYRSTAMAYMWDDHDYGGNGSDGSSPGRRAAMFAYREYVPSYDLSGDESAVYQAFTAGRVRFIMTDARSARNLDNDVDTSINSMLGFEQLAWFENELVEAARTHELVVWVNSVPWIAEEKAGADHWGGYANERQEISDLIAENGIDNLLMISGDAHMLAIDDGTNSDFSTDGYQGFPVLHAAALDRPGSTKGGPYSEGEIPGSGQFGTVQFEDDGTDISVTLRAVDWEGNELITYEFSTAPADAG